MSHLEAFKIKFVLPLCLDGEALTDGPILLLGRTERLIPSPGL